MNDWRKRTEFKPRDLMKVAGAILGLLFGILFIIWVALLYAADGAVRRVVRPLVHVAMPVMRGITLTVAVLLWPLTFVVGQILCLGARR